MHTIGHGIWQENRKTWKMRHKQTLTWNMAGNTQKRGKLEMHTVGPGIRLSKLKIMENYKHAL